MVKCSGFSTIRPYNYLWSLLMSRNGFIARLHLNERFQPLSASVEMFHCIEFNVTQHPMVEWKGMWRKRFEIRELSPSFCKVLPSKSD
jgi:hypothetical protein